MTNRHKKSNRCPKCNAARFTVKPGYTKPEFVCENGCYSWQSGKYGEPYLQNAKNFTKGETWKDYVGYMWIDEKTFVPTGIGEYDSKMRWIGP